ncbi:MAG: aspartate kinase [Weeksellaceae bacterium]
MKVFKFGGASVKDAASVRNIAAVLKTTGCQDTFMVISAMGKTTNALEEVVNLYIEKQDYSQNVSEILLKHTAIADELFENSEELHQKINLIFEDLNDFLDRNKSPNYSFIYDQVVGVGELVSTKIVSFYLNSIGIENTWIDVRDYLKTDSTHREGKVDWETTEKNFNQLEKERFYVTQGFLGSDSNHFTTTLGREGSDYTAAIIAYCLNAKSMTIWKDVPGVLNADPRYFEETQLLNKISYEEAIELAYYGASVIHPKTLKPLRQKGIPFYVKSFLDPEGEGTQIQSEFTLDPFVTCYILKKQQNLLTLTSADFSFITEDKISKIFHLLHELNLKVNMMQNSAISLSLCLEDKFNHLQQFLDRMKGEYDIEIEKDVSLYTLRHFDEKSDFVSGSGKELLRQHIKNTLQIIVKEE